MRWRMHRYLSQAYFEELASLLNADAEFQKKAGSLTTRLLFIVRDRGQAVLFAVDHGKVSVTMATPEAPADFVFTGDYATWVTNHRDGVTLEKLIMTGKVKMKGSIPRILGLKSQLGAVDQKGRTIPVEY